MWVRLLFGFSLLCLSSFDIILGAKNVLLINSYHHGLYWSDEIFKGAKKVIDQYDDINLFSEYMDTKRFRTTDTVYLESLLLHYKTKYKHISFNVIICGDNAALDFVIRYKDCPLFKGYKVYCGIPNIEDYQNLGSKYYGVRERDFFIERITSILKFLPKTQKIYYILDKSYAGAEFRKCLEKVTSQKKFKVELIAIDDYDLKGLYSFVSTLSDPNAVIDYVGVNVDKFDNPVDNEKTGKKIVSIAKLPVFSNNGALIGSGIVGGVYQLGTDQGEISAKICAKLIEGDTLQPRVSSTPMKYIYDYSMLKKYNFSTELLPIGSKIINIPEKIYIKYKSEFIIALVSFVIMLGVIIQLLINVIRRKKSELSLIQSEQKFRDIAEMLPQTIYESDMLGNLTFINKQALEMFNYSHADFNKGVNISQLFLPEEWDRIKKSMSMLLEGKTVKNHQYTAKRKDGSTFPFEVHSNVIYKDGKPIGFRGLGIDNTKQKEVEQALIFAREKAEQSDKLKSAFLSNMSHEIRTPLNAIIGFSSLISDGDTTNDQKLEYKKYIQNSSEYLLNLINDIIDHSRIEAGQLEIISTEFNLYELMKELYLNFKSQQKNRHKEHVELVFENMDMTEQIVILADPVRIKQIVANLLDNAFKFTDYGSINFGYALQSDNHILITVKDTGIGINEEDKPLVFKRFYKLCNDNDKLYGGSGLGLSICKNLVGLMNGNIWLDSKRGEGTTFYINLPIKIKSFKQVLTNHDSTEYASNYNWSHKIILIAEDEISNFELIKAFLKNTSVEILHAENGKEAVDITLNNPVDLILMDIQMPILNGHEAIRLIRHHKPGIPIIAQTAYAMAGEKEEILQSGSDAYLAKPLDKIVLLETINQLINHPK